MKKKLFVEHLLIYAFIIYFFITFLPIPWGISTGLDPSWQYAISYASDQKMTFGKEIIFTYGPLGFLIHGSATESNFQAILSFRWAIHLILSIIFGIEIFRNYHKKDLISLSIIIFFMFSFEVLNGSTDYALLLIFLMLLPYEINFRRQYQVILCSSLLGILAGICLTMKFTLGVSIFGASLLYYIGNILNITRSNTTSFLHKPLIFIISSILTLHVTLNVLSQNSASVIEYLKNCLEISSGYSTAMSIVGSAWETASAIFFLTLILVLLVTKSINNRDSMGYNLALAFISWIAFKHGFVRQDAHVLIFVSFVPFVVYLCLRQSNNNNLRLRKAILSTTAQVISILVILIYLFIPSPFGQVVPNFRSIIKESLFMTTFTQKLNYIFHVDVSKIIAPYRENLFGARLPIHVMNEIKDKIIDVIPWEISLIPANNLMWQPRPVFQSYSAYTSSLDNLNAESILMKKRDYILYNFQSIDGRHPFFDEPETFFYVFCNYTVSPDISGYVNTDAIKNIMILRKREKSICSPSSTVNLHHSILWKNDFQLNTPSNTLVRASIKFNYSLIGKIYKTLFRLPPIYIKVIDSSQGSSQYRIVPDNAPNGIIINFLPQDPDDVLAMFRGDLPIPVKRISFSTSNYLLFSKFIDIKLLTSTFMDEMFSFKYKNENYQNLDLKDTEFKTSFIDGYDGWLDNSGTIELDKNKVNNESIYIKGWAYKKGSNRKKEIILITHDSNHIISVGQTGRSRYDVSAHFQDSSYDYSGWRIHIPLSKLPRGLHTIRAWIYEPSRHIAVPIRGEYKILIY